MDELLARLEQKYAVLSSTPVPKEGNISWGSWRAYVAELSKLTQPVKRILEIGFNAGHSCAMLMELFPEANILSIDVPTNVACAPARANIERWYPGRHQLLLEDSRTAVPQLEDQFDLIFIDGHHDYPFPQIDLFNCQRIAAPNAIVIIDDAYGNQSYSVEPNKALRRFQDLGGYSELGAWQSSDSRYGFSYGRYGAPVVSLDAALNVAGDNVFSILIGCYGNHPNYSLRAVRSVLSSNRAYDIHVACSECCVETVVALQKHFAAEEIDSLLLTRQNINKDPMMRLLIERAATDYVVWMDDDSHFTAPDWADRLSRFIARHEFDVAGQVFFFHPDDAYRKFRNARPWWRGEAHFLDPDHATRSWFATGGLFLARTDYLRKHDFPDRLMIKKMDDILLGDMISQTHGKLINFSRELMDAMKISDGNRRGGGEAQTDWKFA